MAIPKISFKTESPLEMSCGVETDVVVTVKPRSKGKCKIVLSMAAGSCKFDNGTQMMEQEVEAVETSDEFDVTFSASITCGQPLVYTFLLNAEATNSEGKSFDDDIRTSVDCTGENADDSSEPTDDTV